MAYRGVLESIRRLERRHADVETSLTAAAKRAYRAAQRQFALTRTHYQLTDCPMPVGG
jgi:phosphopantothenoylcysteine synthetase/decarboxylase